MISSGYARDPEELKSFVLELSERVKKLEDKLQQTQAENNKLREQIQGKSYAPHGLEMPVAAVENLPKPQALPPEKMVVSGNDKIRLTLSGQVNRGVLWGKNGQKSKFFHVDNDNSSTRFRLVGTGTIASGWDVGARIEAQIESNSNVDVDIGGSDATTGSVNFTERKLEVFFTTPMGKLFIGQGETSSDNINEIDLSGTGVVGLGAAAELLAGGLTFRDPRLPLGTKGPRIKDVWDPLDGLGRRDRIRYDSPNIAGFVLGLTHADGDSADTSLKFAGDFNEYKVQAGAAWTKRSKLFNLYNGAVSVLMPCGISLGGAIGSRHATGLSMMPTAQMWHGKTGYQQKWLEIGKTAVAVDYGQASNISMAGDRTKVNGAFLVQKLDKVATELYLGYRRHTFSRLHYRFKTIHATLFGARVKF